MALIKKGRPTTVGPAYQWGSLGGRTAHPADPHGAAFGPTHWPKAQPHEQSAFGSKAAPRMVAPSDAISENRATPQSTTGLVTQEDFLGEAQRLGVLTTGLRGKLVAWFNRRDSGSVGEGMCRMQCNLLIKNAVKKLKGNT